MLFPPERVLLMTVQPRRCLRSFLLPKHTQLLVGAEGQHTRHRVARHDRDMPPEDPPSAPGDSTCPSTGTLPHLFRKQ